MPHAPQQMQRSVIQCKCMDKCNEVYGRVANHLLLHIMNKAALPARTLYPAHTQIGPIKKCSAFTESLDLLDVCFEMSMSQKPAEVETPLRAGPLFTPDKGGTNRGLYPHMLNHFEKQNIYGRLGSRLAVELGLAGSMRLTLSICIDPGCSSFLLIQPDLHLNIQCSRL